MKLTITQEQYDKLLNQDFDLEKLGNDNIQVYHSFGDVLRFKDNKQDSYFIQINKEAKFQLKYAKYKLYIDILQDLIKITL